MILFDLDFTALLALTLLTFSVFYYLNCQNKLVIKDSDVLFSSLILLNGGILLFQGWRLDPLLLFTEIVSTLLIIWFAIENINLRDQLINSSKSEKKIEKFNTRKPSKVNSRKFQDLKIPWNSRKFQDLKIPLSEKELPIKDTQDWEKNNI